MRKRFRRGRADEGEDKGTTTDTLLYFLLPTEGQLDGYQRRKYLAKIIFTYILGYNVDIGHMEAVNLISSPKYSEKQIVSATMA